MLHARIVHKDVDGADLRFEIVDRRAGRIMIGGVEGQCHGVRDLRNGLGEPARVAPVEHDLRRLLPRGHRASASPIPWDEPVIKARLPVRSKSEIPITSSHSALDKSVWVVHGIDNIFCQARK